jgi:hypothetical protein
LGAVFGDVWGCGGGGGVMTIFRRLLRVPLTRRSAAVADSHLRVVSSYGAARVEHVLHVPRGACPVSGNPLSGTLSIAYTPTAQVLEVVSLFNALQWACSGTAGAPRSVEELAAWFARQCASAVGAPVIVALDLVVRPGRQALRVRSEAQP